MPEREIEYRVHAVFGGDGLLIILEIYLASILEENRADLRGVRYGTVGHRLGAVGGFCRVGSGALDRNPP